MYMFCYALLCVNSSFAIILKRKRRLVALLLLSYRYIVTIHVLWLFLTVPWVGLQCVIVVFPAHSHLLCNGVGLESRKIAARVAFMFRLLTFPLWFHACNLLYLKSPQKQGTDVKSK